MTVKWKGSLLMKDIATRQAMVSIAFGLSSAIVISFAGPIYGGIPVILAYPLAFRGKSRPTVHWLATAFGIAWLTLIPVAPLFRGAPADLWPMWVSVGIAPLALAAGAFATRIRQE